MGIVDFADFSLELGKYTML